MKSVFFGISSEDAATLKSQLGGIEAVFVEESLSVASLAQAQDADIISVFVGSEVTKEHIDALPNLKLITTRSVGYDHIDVAHAKEKGIAVCTVPAYGTHTVAEFAFALILALSRNIVGAYTRLHMDTSFDQSGLMGFDLFGKTLGVVGTGKIGKNAARIGHGFGMKIVCYDLFPDQAFATEVGATYVDLPALLSQSDVVTLHAPYTKDTHHLINSSNISSMKHGALLINTARGELIETAALLAALRSGALTGAGLDVFEGERKLKDVAGVLTDSASTTQEGLALLLADEELIHSGRVVATPHVAYFTKEAKAEILRVTAENIEKFIAGTPQNLVPEH